MELIIDRDQLDAFNPMAYRSDSVREILRSPSNFAILNHMVQYSGRRLDDTFAALSDSTRRGVLLHLGQGSASITDLAERFHMSLTGMKKHVGILEQAGLVKTEKIGRVRTCMLGSSRLASEMAWIEKYRDMWDKRFDASENVVQELKQKRGIK